MSTKRGKAWGPDNPHPLSVLRTELVWEGKYDEYGDRRLVDVAGQAMPMQRIETVDQPRSEAAAVGQVDLFEKKHRRQDDFRNLLVWGDNKLVTSSLLKDFAGKLDLIYIDPPFDVGADFTMTIPLGEESESVFKDQSTLEMVAYRDMWGRGTDSYLAMMSDRLSLMHGLLSDRGSLFVHVDWRVSQHLRLILDELFGRGAAGDGGGGFRNEIAYCYSGGGVPRREMPRKHDTILWYTKSPEWTFNTIYRPYSEGTVQRGRTAVKGPDAALRKEGTPINDWWPDVKKITSPTDPEKLYYNTQKSEALLERIINMCSEPDHLVGDFFCGSGTTGAVAERLGRRWIMADLGRFAIHTSRKRIIDLQRNLHEEGEPYRAFDVYNLGRYERQWWQKERLSGADEEHRRVVLEFFKAEILEHTSSPYIHGRKGPAFCHVDSIDSIFTRDEARAVAKAVAEAGGKECFCLAWEFEMEIRQATAALERELGVKLKLIQIPREIMEKQRSSPPPFLEMAVLEAEPIYRKNGKSKGKLVDIRLKKFLPSLAEVPTKELEALRERAIKSGFDFIDFWAVDFDWVPEKPFNHHWQDYRTRKDRSLLTESDAGFSYPKKGKYTACVKVVDVFGCDTSITLEVKV
ncbi:MAG: site-specific DNA-methyltransferase [bacterium]|nr:site-specific DNA-methyltransferase [bacterium]